MVEKRMLIFATLATLVWAVLISSLAAYLYLENTTYIKRISQNQESLNDLASAYSGLMSKYDALGREYSMLYGMSHSTNYTSLMEPLGRLIDNLEANYSFILVNQKDLNITYHTLREDYQKVYQKGNNITREDFGELLEKFYELVSLLTLRELSSAVSKIVTLSVSIVMDYGNGTIEWHNDTEVLAGSSLFQLTQKVAMVNYTYYQFAKPGHIFVDSINDKRAYTEPDYSEGWAWIWYYWDNIKQEWVSGIVGCDAWMLENGGIYKWQFEHWSWP